MIPAVKIASHFLTVKTFLMLEVMKINRLVSLRNQYLKLKAEARKTMATGDLKDYYQKLSKANKIKNEISETLSMKV